MASSSSETLGTRSGEWAQKDDFGPDTVGIFRPGNETFYLRFSNSQGNADAQYSYGNSNMLPVAGNFGSLPGGDLVPPPNRVTFGPGTWIVGTDIPPGTYRSTQFVNGCYWARLSGLGGGIDGIITNDFNNVHQIVTINPWRYWIREQPLRHMDEPDHNMEGSNPGI